MTRKKTRTWRRTKLRKDKWLRAEVVESWTSWLPSLCHPPHGTSANRGGQLRRLDTQTVRTRPSKSAPVCSSDVLRVLRVLPVPEVCF